MQQKLNRVDNQIEIIQRLRIIFLKNKLKVNLPLTFKTPSFQHFNPGSSLNRSGMAFPKPPIVQTLPQRMDFRPRDPVSNLQGQAQGGNQRVPLPRMPSHVYINNPGIKGRGRVPLHMTNEMGNQHVNLPRDPKLPNQRTRSPQIHLNNFIINRKPNNFKPIPY